MSEEKFYVEYRCSRCRYTTVVTNVCRTCVRNMYATGRESRTTETGRRVTRNITKSRSPKNYEEAIMWNGLQIASDRLDKRLTPVFAFRGEENELK